MLSLFLKENILTFIICQLSKRGFSGVTAMDFSAALLNIGRKRCEKLRMKFRENPDASSAILAPLFIQGEFRHMPQFSKATFDKVLLLGNSFGYLETKHELNFTLVDIARIMKPGGVLVLEVFNGEYPAFFRNCDPLEYFFE